MADPAQTRKSTASERVALIREIQVAEKEKLEERAEQRRSMSRGKGGSRLGVAVVLGAFLAWLWVAPPAWLNPPVASRPSPAVQEAGARYALYLQAQQVESFRQERGRLPTNLAETGEPITGINYSPGEDGYWVMSAGTEGSEILLTSSDSLDDFLGNSLNVLQPAKEGK